MASGVIVVTPDRSTITFRLSARAYTSFKKRDHTFGIVNKGKHFGASHRTFPFECFGLFCLNARAARPRR